MRIALNVARVVLTLAFLGAGAFKLSGTEEAVKEFETFGLPQWFRIVTGMLEISGAIGLWIPKLHRLAAAGLGCTMIGALATHAKIGDAPSAFVAPMILGALAAWVALKGVPPKDTSSS